MRLNAETVILEKIKDKVWTDEEFMALADDGNRYEIVDGELILIS
ncbi:hypothetical protein BMF77_02128 [Dolichospermum sp. UHCC 0315A]|jgi:hypothetical protein|nr:MULTISPECIES: hypothetical protein [Dolichospermum]MDB9439308.1 hypothetical protein [Dolichospermum lemmermannii CS-548]QEI41537.1 hypothetical protein BMF77_02128 [Dolichospermum sp. UHCC 0315A]